MYLMFQEAPERGQMLSGICQHINQIFEKHYMTVVHPSLGFMA